MTSGSYELPWRTVPVDSGGTMTGVSGFTHEPSGVSIFDIGINGDLTFYPDPTRLGVTSGASVFIYGAGNTSGTTPFAIGDSTGVVDFRITGNGYAYFSGLANFASSVIINNTSNIHELWFNALNDTGIVASEDMDQLSMVMTNTSFGRGFVLGGIASRDFDHAVQPNPTFYIHSVLDPNTDNTIWGSFARDNSCFVIDVGVGLHSLEVAGTTRFTVGTAGVSNYGLGYGFSTGESIFVVGTDLYWSDSAGVDKKLN